MPLFGRALMLQQEHQSIQLPALKPIFTFLRTQTALILQKEYEMNVTAGYYEAKLPASDINNCRTMALPFVLVQQL